MKETKFRAIHKLTKKKWTNEELVFHNGAWYEDWRAFEDGTPLNMTQCAVVEYTGLKDKNGVEIYESDILEFDDMGEEGFEYLEAYDFKNRALVCFENGRFELGYFLSRNSAVLDEMNNATHEEFIANITESLIIGNIYENPELLDIEEREAE